VTDITLWSLRLLESIISWDASSEPSLSNDRIILFTLQASVPVRIIRNPRGTNLGFFKGDLGNRLYRGPEMVMKMERDWGLQFTEFSRPLFQLTRIIVLLDLLR